jgi:hypothetical protein
MTTRSLVRNLSRPLSRPLVRLADDAIIQSFAFTSETPSEFTFTRSSANALYRDSNGDWQIAGTNVARYDHDSSGTPLGFLHEGARTNKNKITDANYNIDASDASGLVTSGSGTVTAVDYSTEIAAAGLDNILTNGNVYQLTSTSGTFNVKFNGTFGNTNAHSWGAWVAYGGSGFNGTMKFTGDSEQILMQQGQDGNTVAGDFADLRYVTQSNRTPTATTRNLEINVSSGNTVYVILMDTQEGGFMSSIIANSGGGTATRARDLMEDQSLQTRNYWGGTESSITALVKPMADENLDGTMYVFQASNGTGTADNAGMEMLDSRSKFFPRLRGNSVAHITTDVDSGYSTTRYWPVGVSFSPTKALAISGIAAYEEADISSNEIEDIDRLIIGSRSFTNDLFGHVKNVTVVNKYRNVSQLLGLALDSSETYFTYSSGGQSNMVGYFNVTGGNTNGGEKVFLTELDAIYGTSTENFVINGGTNGSAAIKANAGGGDDWWYDPDTGDFGDAYTRWATSTQAALDNGVSVNAILWDQGEADVASSEADYEAALTAIYVQMRTVASVPIIIVPIGARSDSQQTGYNTIRAAQKDVATTLAYVHLAPEKFDNTLEASGPHLTDAGYANNAPRVIRKAADVLGESITGGVDGATITNAVRSTTTITVTIAQDGGTDFTPTSAISGFHFFDDAVEINITAAVRTNATTITLTLASTPTGVETLYYGYASLFTDTIANLVVDNDSNGILPLRSDVRVL